MQDKLMQFTQKLGAVISDALENEDNENYIGMDAVEADTTEFFHALANLMPGLLYNKLCGADLDMVGFNHVANRLCIQFANKS